MSAGGRAADDAGGTAWASALLNACRKLRRCAHPHIRISGPWGGGDGRAAARSSRLGPASRNEGLQQGCRKRAREDRGTKKVEGVVVADEGDGGVGARYGHWSGRRRFGTREGSAPSCAGGGAGSGGYEGEAMPVHERAGLVDD